MDYITKTVIFSLCLIYVTSVQGILQTEEYVFNDGTYTSNRDGAVYEYNYETENGISKNEAGILERAEGGNSIIVQGYYKHASPGGGRIRVSYIADKNGYRPMVRFMFTTRLLSIEPEVDSAVLASLAG